ncbi:MAG: hypothetical protein ACKOVH_09700, partial [Actinomycetota bacterium]
MPRPPPTDRTGIMIRATLQAIAAHRSRLAASVVAVTLGVALVVGAFVLVDTFERSTDDLFGATLAGVDLELALRDQAGPEGTRERFPEAVAARVAAVPGVATARGVVWGPAQLVGADGAPVRTGLAPTLATSWSAADASDPDGVAEREPVGARSVDVDRDLVGSLRRAIARADRTERAAGISSRPRRRERRRQPGADR